jgi:hypothetical protein
MKNKENVFLLKQKAHEIYEKLSVLAFVEEYVNATPNLKETRKELTAVVEAAYENKNRISDERVAMQEIETVIAHLPVAPIVEQATSLDAEDAVVSSEEETQEEIQPDEFKNTEVETETIIEQPFDDLESLIFEDTEAKDSQEEVLEVLQTPALTLEEELEDVISVDVIADLFEPLKPISLNDKLQANIQIDLNDRIVFVKNLFDGSQEDFNRVVSQLNSFKTEKEAKKFISKMVKPDYNWEHQEALENRFITIIERRFA